MKPRLNATQIARRCVQLGVVAIILLIPAVARYHNYVAAREVDRVLERWEGTVAGTVIAVIDRAVRMLPGGEKERVGVMQRDRDHALAVAQSMRGGVWSAQIGPLSMTDPLAAAESVAATRRVPWVLVAGLLVPVAVTLFLGRVFCSWICPMGLLLEMSDKLRRTLRFLELRPRNLLAARSTKYVLLATGLLLAFLLSMPVLGTVYPPAILSRELHELVFHVFDRAELGRFGVSLQGLSWMMLIIVAIVVVEITVSRRWWCRYVCPGGALYSLIGHTRPVRVKLYSKECTQCALCVAACPMGLNPMHDQMGTECDNCGVCISACNDDALGYALDGPLIRGLAGRAKGGDAQGATV
ncbi:MAG: 4Fe-4S binding protein [Myxococcales bacterium]|nr:MAG: 4Fe-4S binding protein [Myxococcales bacterium]